MSNLLSFFWWNYGPSNEADFEDYLKDDHKKDWNKIDETIQISMGRLAAPPIKIQRLEPEIFHIIHGNKKDKSCFFPNWFPFFQSGRDNDNCTKEKENIKKNRYYGTQ